MYPDKKRNRHNEKVSNINLCCRVVHLFIQIILRTFFVPEQLLSVAETSQPSQSHLPGMKVHSYSQLKNTLHDTIFFIIN